MARGKPDSEAWFERYLRETGHDGWQDPEPDLGVGRRPDYLISKAGAKAVVEVKQFGPLKVEQRVREAMRLRRSVTLSGKDALRPMRNKITEAARQLRPLRDRGLPLVIVLANPLGSRVDLRPLEIGWAMYGDPTVHGLVNPVTGEMTDLQEIRGLNGALTNSGSYVSAVVVLALRARAQDFWDEWTAGQGRAIAERHSDPADQARAMIEAQRGLTPPEGDYPFVRVLHTAASREGGAVALANELFDGPKDQHWFLGPNLAYRCETDPAQLP